MSLRFDGLKEGSTVIAVAVARAGTPGIPVSLQILGDGRSAEGVAADELVGDGTWTRMGAAVEEGRWQDGAATLALRVAPEAGTSFEVGEIRVVVDGQTVLSLDGPQLAALAR